MLVHGIDGGSISVRIHRFNFMSIGQDQIASPPIGIGESQLVSLEMILGLDYLRLENLDRLPGSDDLHAISPEPRRTSLRRRSDIINFAHRGAATDPTG